MSASSSPHEEKFLDATQSWNLEQIYTDLAAIKQKPLSATERICLRGLLCGFDPKEIATTLHRQPQGLRVDLTRGVYRYVAAIAAIQVKNWRDVAVLLERKGYKKPNEDIPLSNATSEPSVVALAQAITPEGELLRIAPCRDWGDAPDVPVFFGRTQELEKLEQWVGQDHCRMVAILGMGGIGKTGISLQLARHIQDQFQWVIWRSLLNAPPLIDLLADLIRFLSGQQESTPLSNPEAGISRLLHYLRMQRCLLILDNVETVLQGRDLTGAYRDGYEGYAQLFHQVGAVTHQSCVILTSREKPREIARLEGRTRPVRSLEIQGLDINSGKQIFAEIGNFATSEADWQSMIEFYNGNPLVLELVAKQIDDSFGGDISAFLKMGTSLFHDLHKLLDWHFDRLSEAEQEIMVWLAINREPVAIAELKDDLLSAVDQSNISATFQSLQRRFPLERRGNGFTQQPAVMEYVTKRILKWVSNELITITIQNLNRYAFIKAQAKDYIRESQIRIFVEPILAMLQTQFHSRTAIVDHLQKILRQLRKDFVRLPGYAGGNLINLLCQLKADLTDYDFSQLSIWQAYLAETKLHRVNLTGANLAKSVFAETFGGISCVAFSPDGQWIATSDMSGEVQLWNARTGQQHQTLQADAVWTWVVAFSLNNQVLATAGDDYQVKLWDVQTGKCLHVLTGHDNTVNAIAFSPSGNLLASGGQDATIRLWALEPATCVGILQGHQGRIWSLAFSPDGQTLFSGSEDCTLKRWDVSTGTCRQTWSGHSQWIKSIACSPDGRWVASGSFDGTIRIWDATTGDCQQTWQAHQSVVTTVDFYPNGSSHLGRQPPMLASSSYDQMLKLWDISIRTCLKAWQAHSNRVWSVAFSPDGLRIASGGEDHATRLWDIPSGQLIKTWKGHANAIFSLAIGSNQTYLATGHEDQTVKVWHLETGDLITTLRGHTNRVWSVAVAPPGSAQPRSNMLASGSADRTIKLWNVDTGECLSTLQGHTSWVWSVAFSPTQSWLASGSYDQTIRLWDTCTSECLQILSGHTAPVVAVAFSPDGRQLVTGSFDTTIKLWDLPSGRCLQTLEGHHHSVWAIAFHPNGHQLASCSYDNTVKLWHLPTGQCIGTFAGHTAPVVCLAFSPNGQQIVSGSYDRTLKVWDTQTGHLIRTLSGHTKPVYSVLFQAIPKLERLATQTSPDMPSNSHDAQDMIISSSFDETIQFWNAPSGINQRVMRVARPYEGMTIADVTGLTDAQKMTLYALGASRA
jgi:WD40 repeat protein